MDLLATGVVTGGRPAEGRLQGVRGLAGVICSDIAYDASNVRVRSPGAGAGPVR
jgi:hypothetical protein